MGALNTSVFNLVRDEKCLLLLSMINLNLKDVNVLCIDAPSW